MDIFTTEYKRIRKFRNEPCARGDYSWTEYDKVVVTYNPETQIAILLDF